MLFTSANVDDIRRYYLGTYVKFPDTGDTLYLLKTVDRFKLEGQAENGDIVRLYLDNEHPYDVSYALPHKSYYQLDEYAAQLVRVPAKQYQRGIHPENTQIQMLRNGNHQCRDLTFETLKPFVSKQKFCSMDEAVDANNGMMSCVITPRMAYCRLTQSLFIDITRVADVIPQERKVRMKLGIFENEVREAIDWKVVKR